VQTDIYLKIKRADKHIHDLQSVIRGFIDASPYSIGRKTDVETGDAIYYVEGYKPIPDDVALIAGDVLQNLRSALDYLAWELVLAEKNTPSEATSFPITDNPPVTADQKRSFDRKVHGMGKEAVNVIREIKPYKGGNNRLWRL